MLKRPDPPRTPSPAAAAGLDFDVGIGGSHALFKSAVVGLLAQVWVCDWVCGVGMGCVWGRDATA